MDAEPERGVAVLGPVDEHLVGVRERSGVAVRGRERQQDPVALLERAAVELEVLGDHPRHRHGRVRAQELLDGRVHERGFGREPVAVVGMLREVPQRRADRRPRRVDARDHQQHHRARDVVGVKLVPVELGLQQERGEVVLRLALVFLDARVDVVVELALVDQLLTLGCGHVDVFEHLMDEAAEDVGVSLREAEHLHDDAQGDVLRVLDRGVDLAPAGRARPGARGTGHA